MRYAPPWPQSAKEGWEWGVLQLCVYRFWMSDEVVSGTAISFLACREWSAARVATPVPPILPNLLPLHPQDVAGTPSDLAAAHPDLSAVMNVISALDVLPDGEIDGGVTVFAPNNDAVNKLFSSLGMSPPTDAQGFQKLIAMLGPIAQQLVTSIMYNISPEIVVLPANDGDSVVVPTASGMNFTAVNSDGTVLLKTPGNAATSPDGVKVLDTFMWMGTQIVVTDEVLMPASVGSIPATTPEDAMAKLQAFREAMQAAAGSAPSLAPAPAPASDDDDDENDD